MIMGEYSRSWVDINLNKEDIFTNSKTADPQSIQAPPPPSPPPPPSLPPSFPPSLPTKKGKPGPAPLEESWNE